MAFAFLCDFDGTVAPRDIGAAFVRRFSTAPAGELEARIAAWRAGAVATREVIEAESRSLRVGRDEALAFTRGFALDASFAPFVRERAARGDRVLVASEGYDFYVRDQLERAGLEATPWSANSTRFEDGGVRVEFAAGGCGRCGNCKGARAAEQRAAGYTVVLVGDGLSDRCAAAVADHVIARGDLLDWCRGQGRPADPFASFADVARWARGAAGGNGR